jgi:aminomethyltransferase
LNEQGGVIDDLIVYKIADDCYRLVINAGTREKDLAWMRKQAAAFTDTEMQIIERTDLAMLAVQGPETQVIIEQLLAKQDVGFSNTLKNAIALHPFTFCYTDDWLIARTGYTGEDGYEIMLPAEQAEAFWQNLLDNGIMPCGLGARDSLRLEAGLNLYGADMDETVTPLEANLTWTVALEPKERDFIGRQALEQQIQQGVQHRLVGLVLTAPGVIRSHQAVFNQDQQIGEVTSGGYSPTLDQSIAFARVTADIGTQCWIEIRNKRLPAQVVKPPFVRQGQKVFCTEQK